MGWSPQIGAYLLLLCNEEPAPAREHLEHDHLARLAGLDWLLLSVVHGVVGVLGHVHALGVVAKPACQDHTAAAQATISLRQQHFNVKE